MHFKFIFSIVAVVATTTAWGQNSGFDDDIYYTRKDARQEAMKQQKPAPRPNRHNGATEIIFIDDTTATALPDTVASLTLPDKFTLWGTTAAIQNSRQQQPSATPNKGLLWAIPHKPAKPTQTDQCIG